jgi:hypothetical protein
VDVCTASLGLHSLLLRFSRNRSGLYRYPMRLSILFLVFRLYLQLCPCSHATCLFVYARFQCCALVCLGVINVSRLTRYQLATHLVGDVWFSLVSQFPAMRSSLLFASSEFTHKMSIAVGILPAGTLRLIAAKTVMT